MTPEEQKLFYGNDVCEHGLPTVLCARCLAVEGCLQREVIERLRTENESLKQTNSHLNRRCQQAESAARETVEAVRAKGMSLGRGLANWAATDTARRNAKLREKLIWIRANHDSNGVDCPICMAVDEALNA